MAQAIASPLLLPFAQYSGILAFRALLQEKQRKGTLPLSMTLSDNSPEPTGLNLTLGGKRKGASGGVLTPLEDLDRILSGLSAGPREAIVRFDLAFAEVAEAEGRPEAAEAVRLS